MTTPPPPPQPVDLRLNELVSDNEGVWLDEFGEADDYVELFNASSQSLSLADYEIVESSGSHPLPTRALAPGEVAWLWADDSPEQGELHAAFRLSSSGEAVRLVRRADQVEVDRVDLPALAEHHAFARIPDGLGSFADCGWATPTRRNGERCGPPPIVEHDGKETFQPFQWPVPWPPRPTTIVISELSLKPARFVEVQNLSSAPVDLNQYALRLAPHAPGVAWPDAASGVVLPWPTTETLQPGARVVVPVSDAQTAAVAADPTFEGVLTLWSTDGATALDRVDFVQWPEGNALARIPDGSALFQFCTQATPGAENTACAPPASRPVGTHLRYLRTPGDLSVLASGRTELGTESVEFVIDMESGDVVSLLDAGHWDLHFMFVREMIEHQPHLDRCDPAQRDAFNEGWYLFSAKEYFRAQGRRYLLGTLVHHAGSGLHTVEFTTGDVIQSDQMEHAFFTVMRHVDNPSQWALRPQSPEQVAQMRKLEGRVPIVGTSAPFRGITFQPLTAQVGYGTLRFVASDGIASTPLGPRDILVTDQVPNNIPLLAGLVTESFQTPLAHVNVLSRGRGTPNMSLPGARTDSRVTPFFDKLVRLEVTGAGFEIREADPAEALAYWESRKPTGVAAAPRLDTSVRGVQSLSTRSLQDIGSIGGKAAQFAELARVPFCDSTTQVPPDAFAIPVVHSIEHYQASGASALLDELRGDPSFAADVTVRDRGLQRVRELVLASPVDPTLLDDVRNAMAARWPERAARFRSSSNTEDLPKFNGAGLYESEAAGSAQDAQAVAAAIRTVWSSLFSRRAYDEREYHSIDPHAVGMAVLVHPAYRSEKANGVAISRDALNPSRGDRFYINAQIGEALVTNPAPGVTSDEIIYDPYRPPFAEYQSRSSLTEGEAVLSSAELDRLACNLRRVHEYFRPLIDPNGENGWFAMDIEFKLLGAERSLLIKQARPYSFGAEAPTGWCDF